MHRVPERRRRVHSQELRMLVSGVRQPNPVWACRDRNLSASLVIVPEQGATPAGPPIDELKVKIS